MKLPSYWGPLRLVRELDGADFWMLYDELLDDGSGFRHNREVLLDAWKDGRMCGLAVDETDTMDRAPELLHEPLFARDKDGYSNTMATRYLLPCFCVTGQADATSAVIIWTHTRARRRGLGSALVQRLGITRADNPLEASAQFWTACGLGS